MTKTAIQVLDRAVSLLDAIAGKGSGTLTALGAETKLPVSTVARILESLGAHGLVERDGERRQYYLGARLISLSSNVKYRRDLTALARPILERLCQECEEDTGLSVLRGPHAVILDRVDGPKPLKIIDVINLPVPLYCGAFRKVLVAYQPEEWIERYLATTKFVRFSPTTITGRQAFRRELAAIRERGYADSFGEHVPDAGGVAAPVFGLDGNIQAGVFIMGPVSRITPQTAPRHARRVVDAARKVTARLRGELPSPAAKGPGRAWPSRGA
jgi:DNA-binding IclR family transcriptional regulator